MILSFWLNAFIPRTVTGYTIPITSGTHAGKTAIPMPAAARLLNPFKPLNTGYLTDQRSFDASVSASVRMQSLVQFDITPGRIVPMRTGHSTSGTTEVTTTSGAQTGFAMANMSRCTWTPATPAMRVFTAGTVHVPFGGGLVPIVVGAASSPVSSFSMNLLGQAGDPLINGAADIDYSGQVTVTIRSAVGPMLAIDVDFQGMLDSFPAFEAYASFQGMTKTLFNSPPPPGNTVINLVGGPTRPISGRVSFP
jgi:hypothetical protein